MWASDSPVRRQPTGDSSQVTDQCSVGGVEVVITNEGNGTALVHEWAKTTEL